MAKRRAKKSAKTAERPTCTDNLGVVKRAGKKVPYACGHIDSAKFRHDFYGEVREPTDEVFAAREKCGECMLASVKEFVIRCGACGFAILPGDPVALYVDAHHFSIVWKKIVREPPRVVGCMRWGCCPSGGFFAGHWSESGFEPAFPGGASAAATAFATGTAVVVTLKE